MRRFRVSSFLAEVTQQIHSLRASGVIAAQTVFAAASESMARRKSGGSRWGALSDGIFLSLKDAWGNDEGDHDQPGKEYVG
jgi:hypothetical protein